MSLASCRGGDYWPLPGLPAPARTLMKIWAALSVPAADGIGQRDRCRWPEWGSHGRGHSPRHRLPVPVTFFCFPRHRIERRNALAWHGRSEDRPAPAGTGSPGRVSLADREATAPGALSGGEQQRVISHGPLTARLLRMSRRAPRQQFRLVTSRRLFAQLNRSGVTIVQ